MANIVPACDTSSWEIEAAIQKLWPGRLLAPALRAERRLAHESSQRMRSSGEMVGWCALTRWLSLFHRAGARHHLPLRRLSSKEPGWEDPGAISLCRRPLRMMGKAFCLLSWPRARLKDVATSSGAWACEQNGAWAAMCAPAKASGHWRWPRASPQQQPGASSPKLKAQARARQRCHPKARRRGSRRRGLRPLCPAWLKARAGGTAACFPAPALQTGAGFTLRLPASRSLARAASLVLGLSRRLSCQALPK